jgi:hypothetical protein
VSHIIGSANQSENLVKASIYLHDRKGQGEKKRHPGTKWLSKLIAPQIAAITRRVQNPQFVIGTTTAAAEPAKGDAVAVVVYVGLQLGRLGIPPRVAYGLCLLQEPLGLT